MVYRGIGSERHGDEIMVLQENVIVFKGFLRSQGQWFGEREREGDGRRERSGAFRTVHIQVPTSASTDARPIGILRQRTVRMSTNDRL